MARDRHGNLVGGAGSGDGAHGLWRADGFQELAKEAFRDLLRKHDRPADLKSTLRQSLGKSARRGAISERSAASPYSGLCASGIEFTVRSDFGYKQLSRARSIVHVMAVHLVDPGA